ncbi:hypothetical protein [Propionivibrio sp.]|uniref:hypothetical protein n=1 Tax=Propionivibrio sp. TaxID=2212460 RepID=UPI003BF33F91
MENVKTKFANRLREAMARAGYQPKPAVLEREYNLRCWGKPVTLHGHGVRRWLLGETIPREDKLLVLAEWLQVSPHQLRYGTEIYQTIETRRARWEAAISSQERDVIEAYLSLPAVQRKAVREIILGLGQASLLPSTVKDQLP